VLKSSDSQRNLKMGGSFYVIIEFSSWLVKVVIPGLLVLEQSAEDSVLTQERSNRTEEIKNEELYNLCFLLNTIVACLLKARIVEPEGTAVARELHG
jgi:hypothetical protein